MVHGFTCVTNVPCIIDASTCSTAKVSPHDFAGELTQTSTDGVPDHFSHLHKKKNQQVKSGNKDYSKSTVHCGIVKLYFQNAKLVLSVKHSPS